MPKKKPAKKAAKKRATKATKGARKVPRKAPKKSPGHHLARAHASTMRAVPHVQRADLDAIKRLARAIEHAEHNAKGSTAR